MVALSALEAKVMNILWQEGPSTVDAVMRALPGRKKLKDSTVRTILSRMEKKGFVSHTTEGRAKLYRSTLEPQHVAVRSIRDIVDRFLGGSVEALLVGIVDGDMIDRDELAALAKKVRDRKEKP
jgi:BlaI family penicillinase repressor